MRNSYLRETPMNGSSRGSGTAFDVALLSPCKCYARFLITWRQVTSRTHSGNFGESSIRKSLSQCVYLKLTDVEGMGHPVEKLHAKVRWHRHMLSADKRFSSNGGDISERSGHTCSGIEFLPHTATLEQSSLFECWMISLVV